MIRCTLLALLAAALAPAAVVFALEDPAPEGQPPSDSPEATTADAVPTVTETVIVASQPILGGYTEAQLAGEVSPFQILAQAMEALVVPAGGNPWEQDDFADTTAPTDVYTAPGSGAPWEADENSADADTTATDHP